MATTDWITLSNSYSNVSSTQIQFKYEATRSGATTVRFKLEPRIRYNGTEYSSNAAAVFFTSGAATSSAAQSSFTHSCACNSTYKGGYGPWYGGTGTSIASTSSDYPADGDAWAYGDWSNISVTVAAASTSVTLYFNFYNKLGYGKPIIEPIEM